MGEPSGTGCQFLRGARHLSPAATTSSDSVIAAPQPHSSHTRTPLSTVSPGTIGSPVEGFAEEPDVGGAALAVGAGVTGGGVVVGVAAGLYHTVGLRGRHALVLGGLPSGLHYLTSDPAPSVSTPEAPSPAGEVS